MALKKTIAGYFKDSEVDIFNEDGSFSHKEKRRDFINQLDVDMHPLEEAAMLKHWAISEFVLPDMPSKEEEHEWLIENGPDFVKQKRIERKELIESKRPAFDLANEEFLNAHEQWCKHANLCVEHNHSPDTFEGDANLILGKIDV